jgi:hypothetical protein
MAAKPGSSAWNTQATNYAAMKQAGIKLSPSQEAHLRADAEYQRGNPGVGAAEGRKYAAKQAELAQRQSDYGRAVGSAGGSLSAAQLRQRSEAGKAPKSRGR